MRGILESSLVLYPHPLLHLNHQQILLGSPSNYTQNPIATISDTTLVQLHFWLGLLQIFIVSLIHPLSPSVFFRHTQHHHLKLNIISLFLRILRYFFICLRVKIKVLLWIYILGLLPHKIILALPFLASPSNSFTHVLLALKHSRHTLSSEHLFLLFYLPGMFFSRDLNGLTYPFL